MKFRVTDEDLEDFLREGETLPAEGDYPSIIDLLAEEDDRLEELETLLEMRRKPRPS